MKCQVGSGCIKDAEFTLVHKAIMARPEHRQACCRDCASQIGSRKSVPLIDRPGMDGPFFKLEALA